MTVIFSSRNEVPVAWKTAHWPPARAHPIPVAQVQTRKRRAATGERAARFIFASESTLRCLIGTALRVAQLCGPDQVDQYVVTSGLNAAIAARTACCDKPPHQARYPEVVAFFFKRQAGRGKITRRPLDTLKSSQRQHKQIGQNSP